MASLRRPSGVPRPESQALDHRRPNVSHLAPIKQDARRKSRVGDKIKRRMSMRYADGAEDLTPVIQPPMPGMPNIQPGMTFPYGQNVLQVDMPGGPRMPLLDEDEDPYGGVRSSDDFGGPSGSRGPYDEQIGRRGPATIAEQEWDLEELGTEGMDVNGFVKKTLMGADGDERRRFQSALQQGKQTTAKELQRNVFKK